MKSVVKKIAPRCNRRRKFLFARVRRQFFFRLGAIQRGGLPNEAQGASLWRGGGGGGWGGGLGCR